MIKISNRSFFNIIKVLVIIGLFLETGAIVYATSGGMEFPVNMTLEKNGGSVRPYWIYVIPAAIDGPPLASSVEGNYYITTLPEWMEGKTVKIDIQLPQDLVRVWGIANWDDRGFAPDMAIPENSTVFSVKDVRYDVDDSVFYLPETKYQIFLIVYRYEPVFFRGNVQAVISLVE